MSTFNEAYTIYVRDKRITKGCDKRYLSKPGNVVTKFLRLGSTR